MLWRSRAAALAVTVAVTVAMAAGLVTASTHATSGVVEETMRRPAPPTYSVSAPAGRRTPWTSRAWAGSGAAVTVRIQQYNLCAGNDTCIANPGLVKAARDLVGRFAVSDGAWFISLNEICKRDFDLLTRTLKVAGTMVYSQPSRDSCAGTKNDGASGPFGNAVLHPGGVYEGELAQYLPTQEAPVCAATIECRTMLCLRLGTLAGPMTVCTAHLDTKRGNPLAPPEPTIPQRQASEYLQIATAFAAGRRKVLAGDFNIPSAEVPDVYSTGMRDLVTGNTYPLWGDWDNDPRTLPSPYAPERKIDYIWVDRVGTYTAYRGDCDDHVSSDHCYTRGAWHLPASSPAEAFTRRGLSRSTPGG